MNPDWIVLGAGAAVALGIMLWPKGKGLPTVKVETKGGGNVANLHAAADAAAKVKVDELIQTKLAEQKAAVMVGDLSKALSNATQAKD